MTKPRKEQVSLESTSFYHCYVRCVRKAYLCGEDYSSGQNYDHRKQWIVSRLRFLSYVYAIDICAYAVMSNHYHVVLHVDVDRAKAWSREEVAERWMQLFNGHVLVKQYLKNPKAMDVVTLAVVDEIIEEWRDRLSSISWFMRNINETIARMANEEENCKGRFWEGRFRSQALLDEAALLSCMAYVDLNPIRASMENNVNESDFISVQQRLYDYALGCVSGVSVASEPNLEVAGAKLAPNDVLVDRVQKQHALKQDLRLDKQMEAPLMPFCGSSRTDIHAALPFTREDYFDLVDKTGRLIREDKSGFIPSETPSVISQLGINPDKWLNHIKHFSRSYAECVGSPANIIAYANVFERRWGKGVGCSGGVYIN